MQPECRLILDKLKTDLPEHLTYHTLQHTQDVCRRAEELALKESVVVADIKLLLIAAAYHDSGFLQQAQHHEAISCSIAQTLLPTFGYSQVDIQTICSIIMATKLPQNPHNMLEQIICDADLDYLGRKDFLESGQFLYKEWLCMGLIKNEKEWNEQQIDFLKNHHYFTATSINQRAAQKAINLSILQQKFINP